MAGVGQLFNVPRGWWSDRDFVTLRHRTTFGVSRRGLLPQQPHVHAASSELGKTFAVSLPIRTARQSASGPESSASFV